MTYHPMCRRCWKRPGCSIDDKIQEVYPFLAQCDNIVLASPIWFSSLSGPLLDIASRVQTYFAGRFFRGEPDLLKQKNGVVLLAGAEPGTERKPLETAHTILKHMNVRLPLTAAVCSIRTGQCSAKDDHTALTAARSVANTLNKLYYHQ